MCTPQWEVCVGIETYQHLSVSFLYVPIRAYARVCASNFAFVCLHVHICLASVGLSIYVCVSVCVCV